MKSWISALLLAVAAASNANETTEIEPAVRTSTAATEPAAATSAPQPKPGASTGAAPPGKAVATTPGARAATPAAPAPVRPAARPAPAGAGAGLRPGVKAHDQIDLDATQITGNRELPNVMYVVPWKKPDLGDFAGRPPKSLLDELLAPVDRDVFRRQNRYFAALHPDAAAAPAATTPAPAPGAAATLPAGDEK